MIPVKRETRLLSVKENRTGNLADVAALISVRNVYSIQDRCLEEEKEEWAYFRLQTVRGGWKIFSLSMGEKPRTGGQNQMITVSPRLDSPMQTRSISQQGYRRDLAVRYADIHWNSPNPQYRYFSEDNCTNFISQCVHAGGIPMEVSNNPGKGWWYQRRGGRGDRWSYSWTVAHSFYLYLKRQRSDGLRAIQMESPEQLDLGDVICYDWEGDGRWNHNVIVTRFDPNGAPLVNAHTINSRHRYWEYKDSSAWTPRTKYAFFHIL
ncbi:amidase domain-containing protein [Paenactinomyces guangxiensis]|uniref:Amidase domain-containing protein n=2 Tax=Paenactinomyces guangxiensis TaxID=1490290 RepID=A0A7W1WP88_9BACL|nr:amidase domain-containing protein [Paenactinomyces guangxiensis]MBH8590514.1 amidase domain-containing protein [Paenactinomyces guangxiensis]